MNTFTMATHHLSVKPQRTPSLIPKGQTANLEKTHCEKRERKNRRRNRLKEKRENRGEDEQRKRVQAYLYLGILSLLFRGDFSRD